MEKNLRTIPSHNNITCVYLESVLRPPIDALHLQVGGPAMICECNISNQFHKRLDGIIPNTAETASLSLLESSACYSVVLKQVFSTRVAPWTTVFFHKYVLVVELILYDL